MSLSIVDADGAQQFWRTGLRRVRLRIAPGQSGAEPKAFYAKGIDGWLEVTVDFGPDTSSTVELVLNPGDETPLEDTGRVVALREPAAPDDAIDPSDLTKAQLLDLATQRGIEVSSRSSKADILSALGE